MITASLLISIIVFATSGTADGTIQQYRYAEQLFESGDYQAARREYKRLLFYQPDTEFTDVADYRIAQSYYYQNEPDRAERLFHEFLGAYPNSPFRFQSQLMLGQLQYKGLEQGYYRTTASGYASDRCVAEKKGASIGGHAPCRNAPTTQITANGSVALYSCPWKWAALCWRR